MLGEWSIEAIRERCKRQLAAPLVKIYIPDKTIDELVEDACDAVSPYIGSATKCVESVDMVNGSCDVKDKNISTLLEYNKGTSDAVKVGGTTSDLTPFGLQMYQLGYGGTYSNAMQVALNIMGMNDQMAGVDVPSPRIIKGILYSGDNYTGKATITYVPHLSDIQQITDPKHRIWVKSLSLAYLKKAIGMLKGVASADGLPVGVRFEHYLSEGNAEIERLLQIPVTEGWGAFFIETSSG